MTTLQHLHVHRNYQHYWNRISHSSLESIWKEYQQHLTPACLIMHPLTNPYPQIQPDVEKRRWDYPCFHPFPCCTVSRVLAKLHLTLPFFTDTSLPIWFFLLPWNWRRSSLFPILATAACLFFVLCKSHYFEESRDDSAWRHTGQRKGMLGISTSQQPSSPYCLTQANSGWSCDLDGRRLP